MVCLKALFFVLFSSSYTPLLLALSFQTHLQIIIFMLMTLNSTCHSLQLVFFHNITFLETAVSNVSNWMSTHFFALNPFKTEFLVISLPQQLSKLNSPTIHLPNNVTLTPVDSARNLGVILDKIFRLLNTSLVSPNPAFLIFATFGVFAILWIALQLLLSPHLSFIPKLITATLFSIFLQLKSIVFSFFSILLPVPSPELQNVIISLLF
jgi:hypothetical protein